MEKTIREWFNELPEDIREKAIANTREDELDELDSSSRNAMLIAFLWSKSPEGHSYWSDISKTYCND
jgi:hypothetical protein